MPVAWAVSIWHSRKLLTANFSYRGFSKSETINGFFYKTQLTNLTKYGRKNNSALIGLGSYNLNKWFYVSTPANWLFNRAGAMTSLFGSIFWLSSHFIWAIDFDFLWLCMLVLITLFSTKLYAMSFVLQNHQIIGLMWLPIALFYSIDEQLYIATLFWFLAGLGSITVIFFSIPILFLIAISYDNVSVLIVIIPSLIFVIFKIYPLIISNDFFRSIQNISKMIGLTQRKLRYSREQKKLTIYQIYFFLLYLNAIIALGIMNSYLPTFALLGLFLFILNQRYLRVTDDQHLMLIILSLYWVEIVGLEYNWGCLLVFWIVSNPISFTLGIQKKTDFLEPSVAIYEPYDHRIIYQAVEKFLSCVTKKDRILFSFKDPKNLYKNLFDGYKILYNIPKQVACEKGVFLLPDWWSIEETNFIGSPSFWGRSPKEVIENCNYWNTNLVIIYQKAGTSLKAKWFKQFELLSELDWADFQSDLRPDFPWSKNVSIPKWFLLRKK